MGVTMSMGVAIVGGGIFVKEQHLPAVLACDLLSLKAIYSRSLKSAQDTAALIPKDRAIEPDLYSSDSAKSYDDLLRRADISAVIIALPITAQPDFILQALRAGKHVLAEKPLAEDVATAKALIAAAEDIRAHNGATFAVAENFRFHHTFSYAAQEAKKLGGKVTHFLARVMYRIGEDDKYYKTEWRKVPQFQGGFLLDAGVHFTAAIRLLLAAGGEDSEAVSVQALSSQVLEHLPPVDSLAALIQTRGGGTGIFQFSTGTSCTAFEWDFAYEGGAVKVAGNTVTVKPLGGEEVSKELTRTSGVPEEVQAWAEGIAASTPNALQSPQEALNDLEIMEKMFKSGDAQGAAQKLEFV